MGDRYGGYAVGFPLRSLKKEVKGVLLVHVSQKNEEEKR